MPSLFILYQIQPLESIPVNNIIGYEKVGDYIYLKYLDENGVKFHKKLKDSQFIRTQIEQFQIPEQ